MKKFILFLSLFCLANNLIGQDVFETWQELNDYNEIISQVIKDAEEDNLESTRNLAQDIFERANFLADSQVPEMYDFGTINDLINQLNTDSENLFNLVDSGKPTDEELKDSLLLLNKTFVQLTDLCKAENRN